MQLLLLADVHGDSAKVLALAPEIARAELILLAGDLTEFGGEKEAEELVAPLLRSGAALAFVPGNCDRGSARKYLEGAGLSAEGRILEFGRLAIGGAGGGLLRTGLTPYERSEEELDETLRLALSKPRSPGSSLILLSHTPPYGTTADFRRGGHVGSNALRDILDEEKPLLWVAGHIHEAHSISKLGATTLVNPGSLHDGHYARAEIVGEGIQARISVELCVF